MVAPRTNHATEGRVKVNCVCVCVKLLAQNISFGKFGK